MQISPSRRLHGTSARLKRGERGRGSWGSFAWVFEPRSRRYKLVNESSAQCVEIVTGEDKGWKCRRRLLLAAAAAPVVLRVGLAVRPAARLDSRRRLDRAGGGPEELRAAAPHTPPSGPTVSTARTGGALGAGGPSGTLSRGGCPQRRTDLRAAAACPPNKRPARRPVLETTPMGGASSPKPPRRASPKPPPLLGPSSPKRPRRASSAAAARRRHRPPRRGPSPPSRVAAAARRRAGRPGASRRPSAARAARVRRLRSLSLGRALGAQALASGAVPRAPVRPFFFIFLRYFFGARRSSFSLSSRVPSRRAMRRRPLRRASSALARSKSSR